MVAYRKSFYSQFIGSLLLSTVFISCTHYVANPKACYNDKVKQIINSNCTGSGCHNTKDHEKGFDFTNYDGILKAVTPGNALQSELYSVLNGSGEDRMPPTYSLSEEEKNILKNWINNGAPNNSCIAQVCDTLVFSYTAKINPILASNCIGCHKTVNASGGVILDSHSSVVDFVKTGNRFLGSIHQQQGYSPMPKNSSKLSDCDIRCLEKWIEAGMPNN